LYRLKGVRRRSYRTLLLNRNPLFADAFKMGPHFVARWRYRPPVHRCLGPAAFFYLCVRFQEKNTAFAFFLSSD
jgi:hypothetical protein